MDIGLDPLSDRPASRQLEAQVAARIASGALAPGERLPPERELAAALGVSRMTVRQAFDALARRGLVERGVGRGTFVSAPRVEFARGPRTAGFSEQVAQAGLEPTARVIDVETRAAPAAVAEALDLAPGGAVTRIGRVRSGGGVPLAVQETWLPDALFPGISGRSLEGSLCALMGDRYDRRPVRVIEWLEPVAARASDAALLGVRARSPLMLIERIAYDAAGTPLAFGRDRHRGDRVIHRVEVALE